MQALKDIIAAEISSFTGDVPATMIKDVPPEIKGDFSFPCFATAKKEGKNPQEYAEDLASKVQGGTIEKAEANGGFLNITLDAKKIFGPVWKEFSASPTDFGRGKSKEKILLEHTSANPNAPLHVGHIRNSIIGDSMVRILRFAGYDTEAQFLINDMGGQLAILACQLKDIYENYSESQTEKSGKKPDAWLGEQYIAANKNVDADEAASLQKRYEAGDKDIRAIFDFMVKTSKKGVTETFSEYNIAIDSWVRESDFVFSGAVDEIIKRLKETKYWFEKEGVCALDLEEFGIKKELVLLRSDGTTLYTTRDVAYHEWKLKQGRDCINVIANEQTLQQEQMRAALKILGEKDMDKRVRHLSYELVSVPGMKMSSRTGEFISADELLAEGISRAKKEISKRNMDIPKEETEKIAKAVATGAIRFNMVKITPLKPIEFRWEDALTFDGESAPYMQYSHARACRILERAGVTSPPAGIDFSKVPSLKDEERELLLWFIRFGEVIEESASALKPNLVANYLIALAERFNRFYFKCPVLDAEEETKNLRLAIVFTFKTIIASGLETLGIEALERM